MPRRKNYVKITPEERDFVENVSCNCGLSPEVVRETFLGVLLHIARSLYSGDTTFYLPYIGKITLKIKTTTNSDEGYVLKEDYDIETSPALHFLLVQIISGEKTWLNEFFISQINEKFSDILNINPDIFIDDPINENGREQKEKNSSMDSIFSKTRNFG